MATRKQVMLEAAKHNATVAIDLEFGRYEAIADKGKKWRSNGCGCFVVDYGYRGDSAEAYDELIDGMDWGYE